MERNNNNFYDIICINHEQICKLFTEFFDNRLLYSVDEVSIKEISTTSIYVQPNRLEYAKLTIDALENYGLRLFEPHIKRESITIRRFVPPPIVEKRNGLFVLCDGTHRVYTARKLGVDKLIVLIVKNTYKPLAGDITSWDKIQLNYNHYKSYENFVNFNNVGMTGYSKFCNSDFMII